MPQQPFDAYHELLAIPPDEQPPNLYRLLGVNRFENNRQVITIAAMKQSRFLRSLGISEYADICQKLLNEVAAAKICLLDEKKKAAYDAALTKLLHNGLPPPPTCVRPPAPPLPTAPLTQSTPVAQSVPPSPPPAPAPLPTVSPPAVSREWTIGRSATADVVIDGPKVSAIHCRLTKTSDGRFCLEDLDSTNGTFVNGVKIAGKVPVTRRNVITLGDRSAILPWRKLDE
jgi:hypothetical protein